MKSLFYSRRLLAIALLLLMAVAAQAAAPQNVILIIGDGMGIGAISAAEYASTDKLTLETMPYTGFAKTCSANALVTDSAAAATALASGNKTDNGRISTDPQGKNLPTILELAKRLGKSTGVITTDAVTGATPAAFYSHTNSRGDQEAIASQLLTSGMVVAMGSGKPFFLPAAEGQTGRTDGRDLLAQAKTDGFDVVFDAKSLADSNSNKLLGLFPFDETSPTLEAMLDKSLSVLSTNPNGFFIMAESCLPDKGGHHNDVATVLKGVTDLNNALRCALDFAQKHGHTLVVVTSDHETGGLAVLDPDSTNPKLKPSWTNGGHTGNMVAVFAYGLGGRRFMGVHDNTDIPKMIAALWGASLGQ